MHLPPKKYFVYGVSVVEVDNNLDCEILILVLLLEGHHLPISKEVVLLPSSHQREGN